MLLAHLFLFLVSFIVLGVVARALVNSFTFLARFFQWREFVLVYFVLVLGATIPNFAIGIFTALEQVPDLFLGDVIGNSLITITLIAGLAVLIAKGLRAESRVVQQSSIFLIIAAILPLLLITDGSLSRGDGVVLLMLFFLYSSWLFSKRKLFVQTVESEKKDLVLSILLKNILIIIMGIPLLLLAGKWIVDASIFFVQYFNLPLTLWGIIVVALGTSLPELFFITTAAKEKNNWIALGGIIGNVIVLPTLGLGLIAVILPIKITSFSAFLPLFSFLIFASLSFLVFIRSGKKITHKEAVFLLTFYVFFIITQIFLRF